MKSILPASFHASLWLVTLLSIGPTFASWSAEVDPAVAKANAALGRHLVQLLETRDAKAFANSFTPTTAELESLAGATDGKESLNSFKGRRQEQALRIAQHLLETASRLGLRADRVRFRVKGDVKDRVIVSTGLPYLNSASPPATPRLSVVLFGDPIRDSVADSKFRGEYELTVYQPRLFPGGWRVGGGIWWSRVPAGLADPTLQWKLEFFSSEDYRKEILTITNDPALTIFGNSMIRFLKERDEKITASEVWGSFDEAWTTLLQVGNPRQLPTRAEAEKVWERQKEAVVLKPLRNFLNHMDTLGIDLSSAKITLKEAVAHKVLTGGVVRLGVLDGMRAHPLFFKAEVESTEKSKTGEPIAGEYSFIIGIAERRNGHWIIRGPIAWDKFPEGLADAKALADVAFEKYVAEHRRLPPGTIAPDIRFTPLNNDPRTKLSEFRGKVVVLDFWATWCGPCQEPLSDLQTLVIRHPEWKDRVAVITVSVDENPDVLRAHLQKKGWNQTFNTWAGEGGFASPAAQAFRVSGLPSTYVIDARGTIRSVEAKSPEVFKDAKGKVVGAKLRTVEELEEAISPLIGATNLR